MSACPGKGLRNTSLTCYANVIIQALYNNPRVREKILSLEGIGPVTNDLHEVFLKLKDPGKKAFLPAAFLKHFEEQFPLNVMHDCQEFWSAVLETLQKEHEEFRRTNEGINSSDVETCVTSTFEFKKKVTTTCSKCKQQSIIEERPLQMELRFDEESFTLTPTSQSPTSLGALVERELMPEKLKGDNRYNCDTCGLQDADRKTTIEQGPTTLAMLLANYFFNKETGQLEKILRKVRFPRTFKLPVRERPKDITGEGTLCQELNEMQNSSDTLECFFEVYGLTTIIMHIGVDLNGGHYYMFSREAVTDGWCHKDDVFRDEWFLKNDEKVDPVTWSAIEDVLQGNNHVTVYMVLFDKVTHVRASRDQPAPHGSELWDFWDSESSSNRSRRPLEEVRSPRPLKKLGRAETGSASSGRKSISSHRSICSSSPAPYQRPQVRSFSPDKRVCSPSPAPYHRAQGRSFSPDKSVRPPSPAPYQRPQVRSFSPDKRVCSPSPAPCLRPQATSFSPDKRLKPARSAGSSPPTLRWRCEARPSTPKTESKSWTGTFILLAILTLMYVYVFYRRM